MRAKVRDPRVNTVTITDVRLRTIFQLPKYFSVYPWSENNLKEAHAGLHSAKKFIRMQLEKSLHVIEFRTYF